MDQIRVDILMQGRALSAVSTWAGHRRETNEGGLGDQARHVTPCSLPIAGRPSSRFFTKNELHEFGLTPGLRPLVDLCRSGPNGIDGMTHEIRVARQRASRREVGCKSSVRR